MRALHVYAMPRWEQVPLREPVPMFSYIHMFHSCDVLACSLHAYRSMHMLDVRARMHGML